MKIIFVNLFSILALDNFSIPDGVIDNLIRSKDKNTRIIFLTAPKLADQLDRFVDGETVLVEEIQSFPPKGFIQKLFHFFYAFLIFTGSTKILATFGARADIPPAGGNRFIWPLKFLIANTFGRSRFIKRKVTPWLFQRVFRNRPYKILFEKYNPTLLVAPSLAFFPDVELVSEAKRRKIKTIGMVTNWDHLNKYYIPMHSNYLLVQNEPMKREAVSWHAYSESEIIPVGFPQFDMYPQKEKYLISREEFLKTFGVTSAEKIILFISGAAYSLDEPDVISAMSGWISEGVFGSNVKLLIRPYTVARDLERERVKYKNLEGDPNIAFNWLRRSDNLDNKKYFMAMLAYADVIISIFSTTAIEAAIFDKPTITIGFDGYKKRPYHQSIVRLEDMSHFRNVLDTKSVRVARSFDNLKKMLSDYLENPALDVQERATLVKKMCYKNDGKASQRISQFILDQTNGK